jgi:sulfatase modifying factor 1
MAALCTPAAKASEWVEIEVSYALEIGRAVYPLLAGGDATSAIPLHLFNKQRVDIRSDLQALRSQLVPALHKHLGQRSALGPASPPIQNPKSQIQNLQPKIAFDWVLIPAGEFLMGSDKGKDKNAHDDELPQHKVYLPSYRMARVPVTVAQFRQFIEATGYKTTAEEEGSAWNWAAPRGAGSSVRHKSEHPVTCVSWHDAMKFCEWAGVRLPSEAEWERVARGVDGRIYPWGDEPPDQSRCNYAMNVQDTTAVGSYPKGATAEGLLDMAGNVWEWTSSLYKPYPYRAGDGREDAAASGRRLLRGGSFGVSEGYVRCASRFDDDPDFRDGDGGFRVVLPGSGSSEL